MSSLFFVSFTHQCLGIDGWRKSSYHSKYVALELETGSKLNNLWVLGFVWGLFVCLGFLILENCYYSIPFRGWRGMILSGSKSSWKVIFLFLNEARKNQVAETLWEHILTLIQVCVDQVLVHLYPFTLITCSNTMRLLNIRFWECSLPKLHALSTDPVGRSCWLPSSVTPSSLAEFFSP